MALPIFLFIGMFLIGASGGQLTVGFYSETCPDSESIVRGVVREAANSNPKIAPVLLRLHFHDCFVEVRPFLSDIGIHS